jgi:hypothetical protein
MVASSLVHVGADERWVAEYLLRHRRELPNGRPAASLVIAARCAAEMDLRKARRREVPVEPALLVALSAGERRHQLDAPSVGEVVIDFLEAATMLRLSSRAGELVRDAVAVVVEMAERHVLNGGTGPSLIAMRPAARPEARLVTRLRALVPMASARRLAKLLVGADGTPLETGALWWAARSAESAEHVPLLIRGKWTRDLLVVEAEARTAPIAASRAA